MKWEIKLVLSAILVLAVFLYLHTLDVPQLSDYPLVLVFYFPAALAAIVVLLECLVQFVGFRVLNMQGLVVDFVVIVKICCILVGISVLAHFVYELSIYFALWSVGSK